MMTLMRYLDDTKPDTWYNYLSRNTSKRHLNNCSITKLQNVSERKLIDNE